MAAASIMWREIWQGLFANAQQSLRLWLITRSDVPITDVMVADKYIKTNVLDRVGSGDAFVSGFIYGFLNEKDLKFSINCATAHGVLVMTTVGDNSTATVEEIEHLMRGDSSAAKR